MTDEAAISARSHIEALDTAFQELMALEARTVAPAPLPHQYIGTVVDNACAFLTLAANALDGGRRSISFSETRNWLSLMKGVHRAFFSSIHTAAEASLVALCEHRGVKVTSRFQEAAEHAIAAIEGEAGHLSKVHRAVKDLRGLMRTQRPAFDDYLEGVLTTVELSADVKKTWRRFFKALSIVRNKASHSDPTLTEDERRRLREGGFSTMISATGGLVMNPRMYAQVATFLLDFFDLFSDAPKPAPRNAS